jgi:hypothetical protein
MVEYRSDPAGHGFGPRLGEPSRNQIGGKEHQRHGQKHECNDQTGSLRAGQQSRDGSAQEENTE